MTPALEKQTQEETKHFKEEVNLKRESIEFLELKYEDLDFSDILAHSNSIQQIYTICTPKSSTKNNK